MVFTHSNKFTPIELETVETTEGRFYKTPGGLYESITTALSRNQEKKEALQKWKNRIGEKEANRISRVSANRGTGLHKIAENYLNNIEAYEAHMMPDSIGMFRSIKPILDKSVKTVYMQECSLYSNIYRFAGRCDCIASVFDKITIIDFKNSIKPKKREWIEDYFLQTAAYSFMFEECYNERVQQNMIIIAVENSTPQIFISDPYKYIEHIFFKARI